MQIACKISLQNAKRTPRQNGNHRNYVKKLQFIMKIRIFYFYLVNYFVILEKGLFDIEQMKIVLISMINYDYTT